MSDYQPRVQGWPAQPPANSSSRGGYGPAPHGRRPQRRPKRKHGRGWIALAVVVVVILAVLGIGDQVARSYAENRIAQQIQTSGLNAKPSVDIEGWPFLTQVAAHDIGTIDISADNVTADSGKLPFSFTAKATGVHLNSSFNGATIDQINGQALVPFSSVASLVPGGSAVTISADPADGPNAVKVDLGGAGSVTGTVKQSGANQIAIQLASASGFASFFSSLSGNEITIQIPTLPAGLVVRSVGVTSQGIVADASASNTTLSE